MPEFTLHIREAPKGSHDSAYLWWSRRSDPLYEKRIVLGSPDDWVRIGGELQVNVDVPSDGWVALQWCDQGGKWCSNPLSEIMRTDGKPAPEPVLWLALLAGAIFLAALRRYSSI